MGSGSGRSGERGIVRKDKIPRCIGCEGGGDVAGEENVCRSRESEPCNSERRTGFKRSSAKGARCVCTPVLRTRFRSNFIVAVSSMQLYRILYPLNFFLAFLDI